MNKKIKLLEKIAEELFSLMGTKVKFGISYDKKNEALTLDLDAGDETGLLIGRKGETLTSIETLLGILLKAKTGEWDRVLVNVGDYREKEESYLRDLATSTVQRVRETGEPQPLYNLKPSQRRIIHMFLSDSPDVTTESQGEGRDRYLVVKPKTS